MAKGKKIKGPTLVAPEPAGDEWEADLRWDRVQLDGERPAFFNGSHTAATVNVFDVKLDVKERAPATLQSRRDDFTFVRAKDAYLKAEDRLRKVREQLSAEKDLQQDFEGLRVAEEEGLKIEQDRLLHGMETALEEVEHAERTLDTEMNNALAAFDAQQKNALDRLLELLRRDLEIDADFSERTDMLNECELITDAYYREYGEHVRKMEQMQMETSRLHEQAIKEMIQTLQQRAQELLKSLLHKDAASSTEQSRTPLVQELLKLEEQWRMSRGHHGDVECGTADLQRLVDLEEQRYLLSMQRNATLRKQIEALKNEVEGKKNVTRSESIGVPISDAVEEPQLISMPGCAGMADNVTNELVETRRQLDHTTTELAAVAGRLEALRRQRLLQLSGQYKPISLIADTLKTTQNFFDPETNAAVRATVAQALLEVNDALKTVVPPGADDGECLEHLFSISSLRDRKVVQGYVVRKINKLFTCKCPTAPPLVLLQESAM